MTTRAARRNGLRMQELRKSLASMRSRPRCSSIRKPPSWNTFNRKVWRRQAIGSTTLRQLHGRKSGWGWTSAPTLPWEVRESPWSKAICAASGWGAILMPCDNDEHSPESLLRVFLQCPRSTAGVCRALPVFGLLLSAIIASARLETAVRDELENVAEPELTEGGICSYCDYMMSKDD
jgi:hypothetical protein